MQGDAFLPRHDALNLGGLFQQGVEIEVGPGQDHLARFDLGEIQHIADQGEQRLPGVDGYVQAALLFVAEGRLQQHLAHALDGVERRADLMTHVGKKGRFGLIGAFGGLLEPFQLGISHQQFSGALVDLLVQIKIETAQFVVLPDKLGGGAPEIAPHFVHAVGQSSDLILAGQGDATLQITAAKLLGIGHQLIHRGDHRAPQQEREHQRQQPENAQKIEGQMANLLFDELRASEINKPPESHYL